MTKIQKIEKEIQKYENGLYVNKWFYGNGYKGGFEGKIKKGDSEYSVAVEGGLSVEDTALELYKQFDCQYRA